MALELEYIVSVAWTGLRCSVLTLLLTVPSTRQRLFSRTERSGRGSGATASFNTTSKTGVMARTKRETVSVVADY